MELFRKCRDPGGRMTAACSCPYSMDYYKRVSPDTTAGCESIRLTYNLVNKTGTGQGNVVLRDTLPPGFAIDSLLKQPFLTTYTFDQATGIMEWTFRELVIGKDSLILSLSVPEIPTSDWQTQASLSPLPLGLGTTLYSDNPKTTKLDDPTRLFFQPLSMALPDEAFLCADESLILSPLVKPGKCLFNISMAVPGYHPKSGGRYAWVVHTDRL